MGLLDKQINKIKKEIIKAAKKSIKDNSYCFYLRDKNFADTYGDVIDAAVAKANEELKKDHYIITYTSGIDADYTPYHFHTYDYVKYTFTVKVNTGGIDTKIDASDIGNVSW